MGLIDVVLEIETVPTRHNQPRDIDVGLIDFLTETESGHNLDLVHLSQSSIPACHNEPRERCDPRLVPILRGQRN